VSIDEENERMRRLKLQMQASIDGVVGVQRDHHFNWNEVAAARWFVHQPGQWSRPFSNEEATQFARAEPQTSHAQLKRMDYGGFKMQMAA
jgi:hypothetical protein